MDAPQHHPRPRVTSFLFLLAAGVAALSRRCDAQRTATPCVDLVPTNRQPGAPCGGVDVGECATDGTCACGPGYTGPDCSDCHPDYQPLPHEPWGAQGTICSLTSRVTRFDSTQATASTEALRPAEPAADGTGLSRGAWIAIITAGAVAALAALLAIVWQVRRSRRRDASRELHGNDLATESSENSSAVTVRGNPLAWRDNHHRCDVASIASGDSQEFDKASSKQAMGGV